MSLLILDWSITVAQVMLGLACGCSAYRIVVGPRAQDRILGLDTFYINVMIVLVTIGIRSGTNIYFEAALVIGVLGFVGTVALSKFLMRGEVIE
jgi:multicomponent K+:H+ antiporter subunit F